MIKINQYTTGQSDENSTSFYLDLIKQVGWNTRDSSPFGQALKNSLWMAIIFNKGKPVGACRMVGDGIYNAVLYDLVVLPEFQGQGLGLTLIKAALQHCCNLGINRLECISAPESIGFYSEKWQPISGYYLICEGK
jgi:GNAT superfamily N-acetyltransferase